MKVYLQVKAGLMVSIVVLFSMLTGNGQSDKDGSKKTILLSKTSHSKSLLQKQHFATFVATIKLGSCNSHFKVKHNI